MKTRHILLYVLTLLLSVAGIQSVQAQVSQDALYIFRNDGGFNAFFYEDIDHIEYSKIDTLGVEQTDYVVQEVYAHDTIYRIPVSAIDSVAFVTPEKKIKADVFCPDKLIANYIIASDTIKWIRLASNTPATMIPKVGDKILIEEKSQFIPRGFVGLVTSVENGSEGYTIVTGDLEITDIYERLVVKAAGATPLPNQAANRRGLFDGTEWSYTNEQPIEFPDMSGSITIQGSRVLYDQHDVSLSADGSGSLSFNYVPRIQFRGFLFVDPDLGIQYDQNIIFDNTSSWNLSFTGSLTGNVDIPLKGISKDFESISFGINCGLFINAQITGLTVGATYQSEYTGRDFLYYKIDDISYTSTNSLSQIVPSHHQSVKFSKDSLSYTFSSQGKYTFSAGVYAKAEASFTLPFNKEEVKTKFGARLEAGGHLSFEAPVWAPDAISSLLSSVSVYQLLNKETNISASIYGKFSAYAQFNDWVWSVNPEGTLAKSNLMGLVPNITGINVVQDSERPIRPYRFLFSSQTTNRKVLTSIPVGFAVFDANQMLETDTLCASYFVGLNNDSWKWGSLTNAYNCVMKLDPDKGNSKTYTAYPIIEYLGQKILVDQKKEFTLEPARIDIAEREVVVGADLGSKEIEVVPNMANMEVKAEADWLKEVEPDWLPHLNELTIHWPNLPEDVKDRRGVIRLTGKSQKGNTLVVDSIVVHQFVPFLELSATSLEFSEKGGTKTITIGNTNVKDITVSTNSEDIKVTLEGKTITVTMEKNPTDQVRGGTVYVEGKAPNDQTISFPVIVTQKEGKPVPQGGGDLELSTYSVVSGANGENFVVAVLNENVTSIHVKLADDSPTVLYNVRDSWQDGHYVAMFKTGDNVTREDRYAVVAVTGYFADGSKQTARIVVYQEGYFDITSIKMYPHVTASCHDKDLGEIEKVFLTGLSFPEDPAYSKNRVNSHETTILDDGSIHFEATTTDDYIESYSTRKIEKKTTFSFDLPNGLDATVMNNLVCKHVRIVDGYTEEDITFKATNIPVSKVEDSSSMRKLTIIGNETNGTVFSELEYVYNYGPNSENNHTYHLKHKDKNEFSLYLVLSYLPPIYKFAW
ncbi:MAG: hypothetical protein E7107_09245 [Prevotella sp.]|nr:hypothetical protein [Prevotella sp.]